MNTNILLIIVAIVPIVLMIGCFIVLSLRKDNNKGNINEWSYKRYADFYGQMELADPSFNEKITKILKMIKDDNEEDIEFIAKESGCTVPECSLKIDYLKNKRLLDNIYIDRDYNKIIRCSEEDLRLIEKYKPFVYSSHRTIDEIVTLAPATTNDINENRETVRKELKYLINKRIINGVIYNEVDDKLIYYTVEKHKHDYDYATIECDKCGALNEVNYDSKTRCKYCGNIIRGYITFKDIKKSN